MAAQNCSRCNAPRLAGESSCRRCGLGFESTKAPSARPVLVLRQVRPVAKDAAWEVAEAAAAVGRSGAIRLDHRSVSRRHAIIRIGPEHDFVVEDAGSANGTFVNGRRLTAAASIATGDQISFGDVILVAEIRGVIAREQPADGTVMYGGGPAPQPVRLVGTGEDTMSESPSSARDPSNGEAVRERRQASEPPAPATPIVVNVPVRATRRISNLARASDETAAALRELDRDVAAILDTFEQHGGATALRAFVAQAARVEANPRSPQDVETLVRWLPSARGLLEAQLQLLELLSTRESHVRA
jgi:predicted component of type VI protein secretion system